MYTYVAIATILMLIDQYTYHNIPNVYRYNNISRYGDNYIDILLHL